MYGNHVALGLNAGIGCELQLFASEQHGKMRQVHQATGVVQVHVREDRPAQFARIFTDAPQQLWKRHFRLELPRKSFQCQPRDKRVAGNFLVVVAGTSGVDEQVAGGMFHQHASGGRAERKVAERFGRLDPAGGNAGNRGNHRHHARMRSRRRQWRSTEVEDVQGDSRHPYERK